VLEEERKYEVDAGFRLPDLTECAPEGGRLIVRPPQKLRATYYDTQGLRLTRAGASLRHRRGDDEPWTVKLPTDAPGVRNEISMPGPSTVPPGRLLDLVTIYTRGAGVEPVTVLNTVRQAYQLCDRDDRVAVEVVDDTVSVSDGRRVAMVLTGSGNSEIWVSDSISGRTVVQTLPLSATDTVATLLTKLLAITATGTKHPVTPSGMVNRMTSQAAIPCGTR